jgi:polyhydroxybutyrate depolymerase
MRLVLVTVLAIAALALGTACARGSEHRESLAASPAAAENTRVPVAQPAAAPSPTPVIGSAGCGTPATPGSSTAGLESGGVQRRYRLYIPAGYRSDTPAPLVLNYHGYSASAVEQESYSEYPDAADKYGFVLVTPEGAGSPQQWFLYGPIEQGYVDDFAFSEDLIDHLGATLCIDGKRIYATGLSNGGGMTSLAGCKLSQRLAAIAPVAGSPYVAAECANSAAMPVIAFHGTADRLVPFEAGPDTGRLDHFRFGARNNMRQWAEHNGCNPALKTERIAPDVVLESYIGCREGADVQLYVVEGGGHTWPGASRAIEVLGTTTRSISATDLTWLFFAAHPKR